MLTLKKLALILTILCLGATASAQREKIYLKNGGVIRGTLVQVDIDRVLISVDSITNFSISALSIEGVRTIRRKTQLSVRELRLIDSLNRLPKKPSVFLQFNFGLLYGEDGTFRTGLANLSMDYALHWKSKRKTSIGFGLGLEYYPSFEVIPFFIEYRKSFKHLPSGFFFYAKVGYSLAKARRNFEFSYDHVKGDEAFDLGLGYQWPMGKNKLMITLGYKEQSIRTARRDGAFESYTNWHLRRLAFKIGMTF